MKALPILIATVLFACTGAESSNNDSNDGNEIRVEDTCNFLPANAVHIECPEGHRDSIIPILYGYPSEEMFNQSDSGIIALGGCEVSDCDPNWWCKIHEIGF